MAQPLVLAVREGNRIVWRDRFGLADAYLDFSTDVAAERYLIEQAFAERVSSDAAESELGELRPIAENAERVRKSRSAAAAKWNRARAGRTSADEKTLRRLVKSLDRDEDGRRRSNREIQRVLQARGAPIGSGGNALAKIAKLRQT